MVVPIHIAQAWSTTVIIRKLPPGNDVQLILEQDHVDMKWLKEAEGDHQHRNATEDEKRSQMTLRTYINVPQSL